MSEKYPRGQLSADDEGVLQLGIAVKDKTLIISFFKPVEWIGLDKETALALADNIRRRAEEIS